MRTLAQTSKASQQTPSAKTALPARTHFGQRHEVKHDPSSMPKAGRSQNLVQDDRALGGASADLSHHDFSRIPAHWSPVRVFPKLAINTPGDALEIEADRIADQVIGMASTGVPAQVQRRCTACEDEADKKKPEDDAPYKSRLAKGEKDENLAALLGATTGGEPGKPELPIPKDERAVAKTDRRILCKERAPEAGGRNGASFAPTIVHHVLQSGGQPLEGRTRAFMERSFGHDFSRVRVHADQEASASAASIQANAYTVGQDIVFRAGRYDTASRDGQRLLAHELTHVVQQGSATAYAQRAHGTTATAGPFSVSRAIGQVQRSVATSVAEDGAPSQALNPCDWGLTYPESVDETCVAAKSGAIWKADPTNLKGHYSKQTRLLPSEVEVTGPAGNTTSANHCDQVGELKRLGDCPGKWYMLAAVVAHENVHAAHFGPALTGAVPNITADFNGITVPDVPAGKSAATALAELKALPGYTTAKGNLQSRWFTQVLALAAGDHSGPAAAAEHTIVDPVVTSICSHAKAKKWPACADCPP